ncbi:MAG: hypothetical protein HXY34_12035 [Candidatus Thorarchaeota archaeon]|nr:hypothetical protein [Candidatus Thorarchaeota archaeon]
MERPDYASLTDILEDMNREGGYHASILARQDGGFLIASAVSPTTNRDLVAAMAGYLVDTSERVKKELSLGDIRDISVRCTAGKMVVKTITTDGSDTFLLAVLMPRNIRYHSRPLGKAATRIKNLLRYKR